MSGVVRERSVRGVGDGRGEERNRAAVDEDIASVVARETALENIGDVVVACDWRARRQRTSSVLTKGRSIHRVRLRDRIPRRSATLDPIRDAIAWHERIGPV